MGKRHKSNLKYSRFDIIKIKFVIILVSKQRINLYTYLLMMKSLNFVKYVI